MRPIARRILPLFGLVAVSLFALLPQAPRAQSVPAPLRYQIVDLGDLGGGYSEAFGINNSGVVVGQSLRSLNSGSSVAFIWRSGVMSELAPGSDSSAGYDINDVGAAVGFFQPASQPFRAFAVNTSGGFIDLGSIGSEAVALNGEGRVLLRAPAGSSDSRIRLTGGALVSLGPNTNAKAINAGGDVVGHEGFGSGTRGFLYTASTGSMTFYDGAQGLALPSGAEDINSRGHVVGCCFRVPSGGLTLTSGFLAADGQIRNLGILGGFTATSPTAINDLGQIVGIASNTSGAQRAVIWQNGFWHDLNAFLPSGSGWVLERATDINDRGQIVGSARLRGGDRRAFLLSPELCTPAEDIDGNGNADNDGDGLCDSWEVNGIDVDRDAEIDLNFGEELGVVTNPNRKDVLVEYDWMDCHAMAASGCDDAHSDEPENLTAVLEAFYAGNTENPDGSAGVSLWLLDSEAVPHLDRALFRRDGPQALDDFNDIKLGDRQEACDGYLSHRAIREHPDCEKKLEAWRLAVRYAIFAHDGADLFGASGIAELPGNDFMVTVGGSNDQEFAAVGGRQEAESAAFMHELGHTLGLRHGGGDGVNCKPNYPSIMNYALMFKHVHPGRPLDYSSSALVDLDELSLTDGPIPLAAGGLYVRPTVFGLFGAPVTVESVAEPIDWAGDGPTPDAFSQDVNLMPDLCVADSVDATQADEAGRDAGRLAVLRGFNDWASLQFAFRFTPDFADGAQRVTVPETPELTRTQVMAVASRVDYDHDGVTNFPDNCPALANADQGDANGDGTGDACDGSLPPNGAPTAEAGDDQIVEATSPAGAQVSLDASASTDPDGDPLTFTWTGPFGTLSSATITPTLPLGVHAVTVTVADGRGGTGTDVVQANVRDTTAPAVTAPASITVALTEEAGARGNASAVLAAFLAGGSAVDVVDPLPLRLIPQINGTPADGNTLFPLGTSTVIFRYADASGNTGTASATVNVVTRSATASGAGTLGDNPVVEFTFFAGYKLSAGVPLVGGKATVKAGSLRFQSTAVQMLSVDGGVAHLTGDGLVNGQGGYGFRIVATDRVATGSGDLVQIEIWNTATGAPVLNTGADRPLTSGKVVVR